MKNRSEFSTVHIIALSNETVQKAARRIACCERCGPATMPFRRILEKVSGNRKSGQSYFLANAAVCPQCKAPVGEATLVEGLAEFGPKELLKRFDVPLCKMSIVLVDEDRLAEAQDLVAGCERCVTAADIAFDYLLDEVTGNDPAATEYLLIRPAACPQCGGHITEKTLVVS